MKLNLKGKTFLFSGGKECGTRNPGSLLNLFYRFYSKGRATREEQSTNTKTPRRHTVRMQWVNVRGRGKMSRHTVTNGDTWQILNTLSEEQPTEKLDWPIFCGSRRNKENTREKKVDMVRVKRLSSWHTLSIEFHASWTHFTRQDSAKNSFPFKPASKTRLLFRFKKIILFLEKGA